MGRELPLWLTSDDHGGGLAAIPRDAQPASRFVRAAYAKEFALPAATADINKGSVRSTTAKPHLCGLVKVGLRTECDVTQCAVVDELKHTASCTCARARARSSTAST